MQKSFLVVVFLLFTICNSLFANENYTKEEIQRMISKMVILGFNGENVGQNDEIYKEIFGSLLNIKFKLWKKIFKIFVITSITIIF